MTDKVNAQDAAPAIEADTGSVLSEAAANTQAADEIESEAQAEKSDGEKLEGLYDAKADQSATDETEPAEPAEAADGEVDFSALTMPEGFELDEVLLGKAKPVFEELGIKDQASVQKLVDFFAETQAGAAAELASSIETTRNEWLGSIQSEWGSKYEENLGLAAKAVDRLGGDDLREALNATGAGNNPAIIKAFHQVGKALSEDNFVAGGGHETKRDPMASVYPSMRS